MTATVSYRWLIIAFVTATVSGWQLIIAFTKAIIPNHFGGSAEGATASILSYLPITLSAVATKCQFATVTTGVFAFGTVFAVSSVLAAEQESRKIKCIT